MKNVSIQVHETQRKIFIKNYISGITIIMNKTFQNINLKHSTTTIT